MARSAWSRCRKSGCSRSLLTALAPLADLLLIWQLIGQWIAYAQHGSEFSNTDLVTVGVYYARVRDRRPCWPALFGFLMERGENWSLLWWLLLQRFGYRQLMYYVVVRSISAAMRGAFVGWGKLERTGTVQAAPLARRAEHAVIVVAYRRDSARSTACANPGRQRKWRPGLELKQRVACRSRDQPRPVRRRSRAPVRNACSMLKMSTSAGFPAQ